MADTDTTTATRSRRGFAAMSKEDADRIRSLGGKMSPMKFKKGDARTRAAGRLGGSRSRRGS